MTNCIKRTQNDVVKTQKGAKMTKYEEETRKELLGRIIKDVEIDGFGIRLELLGGKVLEYSASDGGYSCWEIIDKE